MNSTYFNDFIKTAKIKPSKRRIKDDFITLKKIEFWIRALQHSWLFPFPQIYFNAVLKLLSPKVQKEIIDKSFSSFIKERKPIKNSRTNIEEFYRENGCSFSPKSEYIEISDYSSVQLLFILMMHPNGVILFTKRSSTNLFLVKKYLTNKTLIISVLRFLKTSSI